MSVNRITMSSAIDTLSSMFPHIERKVLKAHIFKTNGHMERTVELLLQSEAGGGQTQEIISGSSSQQQSLPQQQVAPPIRREGPLEESMFRHNLPEEFLRFGSSKKKKKKSSSRNQSASARSGGGREVNPGSQIRSDEELARRLQQEFFREAKRERRIQRQRKQEQRQQRQQRQQQQQSRQPQLQRRAIPSNQQNQQQRPRPQRPYPSQQQQQRRRAPNQQQPQRNEDGGFNIKKKFNDLSEWSKKRFLDFKKKLQKKKTKDDMESQSLTAPLNELEDGDEIELDEREIGEDGVLDL